MSRYKEKLSFLFVLIFIALCLLPSIFISEVEVIADYHFHLEVIFGSFAICFFIFSWYGYFPKLVAVIMGVLAFLALVTLMLMFSYQFFIDSNVISLIFETMSQISWMYLRSLPVLFYVIVFILFAVTVFCIRHPLKLSKGVRSRLLLFGTFIFVLNILFTDYSDDISDDRYQIRDNEYLSYDGVKRNETLRSIFPVFIPYIIKDYVHQREEVLKMAENFQNYQFDIATYPEKKDRQVYILVLGENSRADHWGINGYSRDTTPYVSQRDDVINFPHMYILQSITRHSVPVMISRKPIDLNVDYFHEASIISYFKNIGYETAWISLPQQFGKGESAISAYAFEADHMVFINPSGFNNRTKPDYVSIEHVNNLIESSDKDLFIVIHTLGSHQRFYDRYDESMEVFLPDRFPNRDANIYSRDDKEVFINSYDNTILATDDFLNKLFNFLDEKELSSFVLYSADHGEGLFDDGGIVIGHGTQTFATLNPAALFWASAQYREENKVFLENLIYNAQNLTTIDMIFDTLVSLSGGSLNDPRPHLDMTKKELNPPQSVIDVLHEKKIGAVLDKA